VRVRLDHPGHRERPVQVDDRDVRAGRGPHLVLRADGQDAVAAHREGRLQRGIRQTVEDDGVHVHGGVLGHGGSSSIRLWVLRR
jgi:hypothetical protein